MAALNATRVGLGALDGEIATIEYKLEALRGQRAVIANKIQRLEDMLLRGGVVQ